MNKLVVLLAGGLSEEREISLATSEAVHTALLELGYEVEVVDPQNFSSWLSLGGYLKEAKPYIVFNGLHGGIGENGTIQAFLDMIKLPYTGSGYKASAVTMDKIMSFRIASSLGVKVAPYVVLDKPQADNKQIFTPEGVTIQSVVRSEGGVIKPNDSGSSYGVTITEDESQIESALNKAYQYSDKVIFQKFIKGSELTVSILGTKALPVVEIKANDGWYDYTHKYTKGKTEYIVPANIPVATAQQLQQTSEMLFKEFGCQGYARVDFRVDEQGNIFVLEINANPCIAPDSGFVAAAQQAGISHEQLIDRIVKDLA